MSLEAWGDEGNEPATRWEDTLMRQEFDTMRNHFNRWVVAFDGEVPSPEIQAHVDALVESFEAISELMLGEI